MTFDNLILEVQLTKPSSIIPMAGLAMVKENDHAELLAATVRWKNAVSGKPGKTPQEELERNSDRRFYEDCLRFTEEGKPVFDPELLIRFLLMTTEVAELICVTWSYLVFIDLLERGHIKRELKEGILFEYHRHLALAEKAPKVLGVSHFTAPKPYFVN